MSQSSTYIPQALDAEQAVLGAMLLQSSARDRVGWLLSDHFFDTRHTLIFRAISSLMDSGSRVDVLTVKNWLREKQELKKAGNSLYLTELINRVANAANIEAHAAMIKNAWAARTLQDLCLKANENLGSLGYNVGEALADLEKGISTLVTNSTQRLGRSNADIALDWMDRLERVLTSDSDLLGISSGLGALDAHTMGWQPGDFTIVAARPAMGKSDFAMFIAQQAAKAGHRVGVISLEMADVKLFNRAMATHTGICKSDLLKGNRDVLMQNGRIRGDIITAADYLKSLPWELADVGSMDLPTLIRKCRQMVKEGCEMIVIDYLGLVSLPQDSGRTTTELIGEVSRSLKMSVAKDLNIPVIALHQLNRSVETRGGDKRPVLSDLRGSGSLEQDADNVMFLYRPEYYGWETDEEGISTAGKCEIIIPKYREGETGTVAIQYQPSNGRFHPWNVERFAPLNGVNSSDNAVPF